MNVLISALPNMISKVTHRKETNKPRTNQQDIFFILEKERGVEVEEECDCFLTWAS